LIAMADDGLKAPDGLEWVPVVGAAGFRNGWIGGALAGLLFGVASAVVFAGAVVGDIPSHFVIVITFLVMGWTFIGLGLGLMVGEMVRLQRKPVPPGADEAAAAGAVDGALKPFFDALKGLPAQRVPVALGVLLLVGAAYLAKPVG
jgi:hypothetical protein